MNTWKILGKILGKNHGQNHGQRLAQLLALLTLTLVCSVGCVTPKRFVPCNKGGACPRCEGHGWYGCKRCEGLGQLGCGACNSTGTVQDINGQATQCWTCGGQTHVDCPSCEAGKIKCGDWVEAKQ